MPKQNKTKALSEAKREFDKKFVCTGGVPDCHLLHEPMLNDEATPDNLWKFIKSLLKKQRVRDREEVVKEVKGLLNNVLHKEKHDDIDDKYRDEFLPNGLIDISAMEAVCYNYGAIDQSKLIYDKLSTLKSYKLKKK